MRITDFDDLTSALNPSLKTIVYITTGRKYAEMAIISAESLRPHNAGIQTVLFSDSMTDTPFIDFYTDLVSVFGRMQLPRTLAIKPAVLSKLNIGPFLYLDADTFVCGDLTPLWLGLRNYPILMTQDTWRCPEIYRNLHPGLEYSPGHPSVPYFNSGLLLARGDDETQDFCREWARLIESDNRFKRDQLALRIVMERKGSSFGSLPQEYNARTCDPLQLSGRVFMIHDSTYDSSTRRDDLAVVSDALNSSFRSRLWDPGLRKLVCIQGQKRNGRFVGLARRFGRWCRRRWTGLCRRLRLTRAS